MSSTFSLKLTNFQYLIILGVALTGVSAFTNSYDAIAKINEKRTQCDESEELKKILQTRFIVLIVLSVLAIVFGIILAFFFSRGNANSHKVVTYGIVTAGIFGLVYSLVSKFGSTNGGTAVKLTTSWIGFIVFIALGFYFQSAGKYEDLDSEDAGSELN